MPAVPFDTPPLEGRQLTGVGMTPELDEALALLREHEAWRARCLNLIASENAYSHTLLSLLSSDLEQRYANYAYRDTTARSYRGTRYVAATEAIVEAQAKRVFGARWVETRPVSGQVAGVGVVSGLGRPGDVVLELSRAAGGHRLAGRMVEAPLFRLEVHELAFDPGAYNVDLERALKQVRRLRPRFVIVGSSLFLFPHPVAELAAEVHAAGGLLIYDASHVLGLIAGESFQAPLAEGADVVFGSTHKTFPGPQGGIILANDEDLITRASLGIYPALVTNHHLARMPAMAVAFAEMERWGREYATAVIANARALGAALSERGVRMVAAERGWTDSHTLLIVAPPGRSARDWAIALEEANIITSAVGLPAGLGGEGVRIGAQEVTRRGADGAEIDAIASLIARVLAGEDPVAVRPAVEELAGGLRGLGYSVDGLPARA